MTAYFLNDLFNKKAHNTVQHFTMAEKKHFSASITKLLTDLEKFRSVLLSDFTVTLTSLLDKALAPVYLSLGSKQATMDLNTWRIAEIETS